MHHPIGETNSKFTDLKKNTRVKTNYEYNIINKNSYLHILLNFVQLIQVSKSIDKRI